MTRYIKILFCAVIFVSTSNAITPFIPDGMEAVYNYVAKIKSATDIPEKFASEFYLFAKLHIQSPSNTSLLVQLRDARFKLYNGQKTVGYKEELVDLPILAENNQLMHPFKVILDSNGQAEGIGSEKSERLFALNMHKALASLLQIKTIDFSKLQPDTFVTQEHSIYGKGRTVYTIVPKEDKLMINKMRESVSTERLYQLMTTNSEGDICEAPYEEPLAHDSHQKYTFDKENDTYILKHIKSTGGLYFYPFRAKSEAHYITSSVTINFISATPINSTIELQNERYEKGLTYDIFEPTLQIPESLLNSTIFPTLVTIFDEVLDYLQKNHMTIDNISIRKAHSSNSAIHILRTCSFENLESIYLKLKSDVSEIGKKRLLSFHEVIPFVGTHASVVFVTQLVGGKTVNDEKALDMIQVVATYARFPTEALLRNTENMLTWGDDISKDVRKSAALAFGTLIHKTFASETALSNRDIEDNRKGPFKLHGAHAFSEGSSEAKNFFKKHPIYEEYTNNLVNKLKSSPDVESQLLYLQVLFNTKLSLAIPHLIPIVKGEELKNHDVREMAFWALSHMLIGNPDLIVQVYWPLVADPNQHTEFRIAAYYIIIKSRPSLTGMLNLHYALKDEPNTEVYNFHYTYLQAMSQSNDPCDQISRLNAAQILKFTHKPNQQASSKYFQYDFNDEKYGHGVQVNGLYITAGRSKIFVLDVNTQMFNKRTNYYLLFFKVGGLEKQLSQTVEFNLQNSFGLLNLGELLNTISSFRNMKDFQIQISISNNYHTVQLYYFDNSNFPQLYGFMKKLFEDKFGLDKTFLNLNYEDATEVIFPTEIGMPASLEMLVPTMTYKHFKFETNVENNTTTFLIDSRFKALRSIYWGLHFYNPILDIYQGIKRFHSFDSVLPLYLQISFNKEEQTLFIAWKTHSNEETNVFGLRTYATNFVYAEDYLNKNILQSSCAKCRNWVQVTKGDSYRSNYTVFDNQGLITGFGSKGIVFDTEHHANTDSLNILIQGANHSKKLTLLEDVLTLLRYFHFSDLFQPSPGTQGFLFAIQPSVTQVDITFSFKEEITQQKNEFLPGIKFNPHIKYQLHNNDTILRTYDINTVLETDTGHTFKTLHIDLIVTNQNQKDYKICVNSNKTWSDNEVHGKVIVSTNTDSNENCEHEIVDILIKGEQLEKQKTPFHVYDVCDSYSHRYKPDYHSMRCLAAHTSLRKYIYEIKAHETLSEAKNVLKELFEYFLNKHVNNNYYTNEKNNEIENSIKIMVEYTNENDANVHVITSEGTHELTAVPTSELQWVGLQPDNTHFSTFFLWMNYFGMVHSCVVDINQIQYECNEEKRVDKFSVGQEWTLIIGDSDVDPQQAAFLKQHGNHDLMALKLVHEKHLLEIYPIDDEGEQFKIVHNGNELSTQIIDHYKEDWFSFVVRQHLKSVIITMFHFQLHLDYSAKRLIIQTPKVSGISFNGPCSKIN